MANQHEGDKAKLLPRQMGSATERMDRNVWRVFAVMFCFLAAGAVIGGYKSLFSSFLWGSIIFSALPALTKIKVRPLSLVLIVLSLFASNALIFGVISPFSFNILSSLWRSL
jgi:hypothetical protein